MTPDEQAALNLHNAARHAAPGSRRQPLTWDEALAADALTWAINLANTGEFEHAPDHVRGDQGENLFWSSAILPTGQAFREACEGWIDEKKFYHGEKIGEGPARSKEEQVGHYTQVIWPETLRMGMAAFTCSAGEGWPKSGTWVVARYVPHGNIVGKAAWRQSDGNPYDPDYYKSSSYEEEEWIKKYGVGHKISGWR